MSTPRSFKKAFAVDGDRVAVPDDTQIDNTVNYTDGFTPNYSLPITDPAVLHTSRQATNTLHYDITLLGKQLQENGILPWRADVSYVVSAIVMASNGLLYIAVVPDIGTDPATVTDESVWLVLLKNDETSTTWTTTTGTTANNKLITSISGDNGPVGAWLNGTSVRFVNSEENTGSVTISILNNPQMVNVPVFFNGTPPLTGLVAGSLPQGYYFTIVYRIEGGPHFILSDSRCITAPAGISQPGITVLRDSINNSDLNTAATSNAVRLAALNNNFSSDVNSTSMEGSGSYIDLDSGMKIQWGWRQQSASSSNVLVTQLQFDTPFVGAPISVITNAATTGSSIVVTNTRAISTTSVSISYQSINAGASAKLSYLAIGV